MTTLWMILSELVALFMFINTVQFFMGRKTWLEQIAEAYRGDHDRTE